MRVGLGVGDLVLMLMLEMEKRGDRRVKRTNLISFLMFLPHDTAYNEYAELGNSAN